MMVSLFEQAFDLRSTPLLTHKSDLKRDSTKVSCLLQRNELFCDHMPIGHLPKSSSTHLFFES